MLLKVGIDPEAGEDFDESSRGPGRMLVRRLAERCILVAESRASVRALEEAFRDRRSFELLQVLAQLIKNQRFELLEPTHASAAPIPLREIMSADQVATWRHLADLLLVSSTRAELLDLDDQAQATIPEIASLREALNAEAFDRLERQWNRSVPVNTNRDDVWREVFAPLAEHTTHVYIVDRYVGTDLYRRLKARDRSGTKSGAEWFLGRLARSRVRHIHLACSERHVRNDGLDPQRVRETISTWFARLDSKTELDFRIVGGTRSFAHARRISFDGWAGFELHNGLASFERPSIAEGINLTASLHLADEVRTQYQALC